MKKQLLFIAGVLIGFTTQAQCTITPNCTPSGNGYCTVPANNATLQPLGEVGVAYSTIIQFNTEATFGGAPINSVYIEATTLPPGLTIEFNPAGTTSSECFIVGGQAGCATISGIPTQSGTQQSVELSLLADVGGTFVPLTANYFIDVNASTASISDNAIHQKFSISPNPAREEINIELSNPEALYIMNVNGSIIQTSPYASTHSLNISQLEAGVYFIRIASGETQKFIKN